MVSYISSRNRQSDCLACCTVNVSGLSVMKLVCVCVSKNLREMRSKHFLSSGLGLTWQVSRLSLTGCRLDWKTGMMQSTSGLYTAVRQEGGGLSTGWAAGCNNGSSWHMNTEHCLLPAPGRGGAKARANEMLTGCDEPLELGWPAGVPPRQLESPRVQLPHELKKQS